MFQFWGVVLDKLMGKCDMPNMSDARYKPHTGLLSKLSRRGCKMPRNKTSSGSPAPKKKKNVSSDHWRGLLLWSPKKINAVMGIRAGIQSRQRPRNPKSRGR